VTEARHPTPCRFCRRPSWLSDENGPAHPCCRFWYENEGRSHCPACRTSEALRRRFGETSEGGPPDPYRFGPFGSQNDARKPSRMGALTVAKEAHGATPNLRHLAVSTPPSRKGQGR
jgi:hypothetical protein